MDDLFDFAQRETPTHTPKPIDDELWSVSIVRLKTGRSRALVCKYKALGLFPRQRRIGPGRIARRAFDI
jgi:predicted DNA-binding transcriptional regulator AlpA